MATSETWHAVAVGVNRFARRCPKCRAQCIVEYVTSREGRRVITERCRICGWLEDLILQEGRGLMGPGLRDPRARGIVEALR